MSESDTPAVPRHLGLILDGNRRWAKQQGKPALEGHRAGYENLKTILRVAFSHGVGYVSAYVFSTENWQRSEAEVQGIMKLFAWGLKHEIGELHEEGVCLRVIGSRDRLSASTLKLIETAEEKTAANTRGTLLLCLDYGGQQEIADAAKAIVAAGIPAAEITPEMLNAHMYAADVPPIDLVIRTSGEQRLSNFRLWQAAYAELIFTDTYWPAFGEEELLEAFATFAARQRRFGA